MCHPIVHRCDVNFRVYSKIVGKSGRFRVIISYVFSNCLEGVFHMSFCLGCQISIQETLNFLTAIFSGGMSYEAFKRELLSLPHAKSRCSQKWNAKHTAYRCKECGITSSSCICVECFDENDHIGHTFTLYSSNLGGCCDCGLHSLTIV